MFFPNNFFKNFATKPKKRFEPKFFTQGSKQSIQCKIWETKGKVNPQIQNKMGKLKKRNLK